MVKKSRIMVTLLLVVLSVALLVVNLQYPSVYLEKLFYSVLALAIAYLLFEVVLEEYVTRRIKDSKTRYNFRKALSILNLIVSLLAILVIWITETQNILIAFGLIGAAVAFALQDLFKNFIGGIMLLVNGTYRVGDRIEVEDKYGDVIDIGIFYTTLMETREWVSGDQVTGRLTTVPNGIILAGVVQNYTRDFDFIWDEMTLPITYDSDWKQATTMILDILKKETLPTTSKALKIMEELEGKYYFTQRSLEPSIFITLTDNWVSFGIRYITEVRQRRVLHDRMGRMILEEIGKSEKVKIASSTIDITGFPPVQVKQEQERQSNHSN